MVTAAERSWSATQRRCDARLSIAASVVSGKASFWAGGRKQAVAPGSVIFVERAAEHRFVDITEDFTALVLFAPPEGSLKVE